MTSVEVNPQISIEEWQTYVHNHSEATYYHLPQWQAVIKESLHYRPFYLFARDGEGKLCGILPLFQIRSVLTGNRLSPCLSRIPAVPLPIQTRQLQPSWTGQSDFVTSCHAPTWRSGLCARCHWVSR